MNGRCHPKDTSIFNTEKEWRTTEVNLARVQRIQSILRGPPWPSLVLRVRILSCGLSDRSDGWTFTRLPWFDPGAITAELDALLGE